MVNHNKNPKYPYLDSAQPIDKRVEDLISRMTVEEKVAQLGSTFPFSFMQGNELAPEKMKKLFKNGIGQITRLGGVTNLSPEITAKLANRIQKFLKEETHLGIPVIIHEECLCGYMAKDATIFPQIIGVASTWDPDLVELMTKKIKDQMRIVGAHQGLSPVLDIARDPRWGRTEETFGEDPYLVSCMGHAYVKGLQGDSLNSGIIATAKHFVGYGLSQGGMNWAPTYIPKRELLDVYTKPFEAAIRESNLASVMNAYSEIDGLPCGFSREILTELLRDKLGFRGMVVSDYATIELNSRIHGIEHDPTNAAIRAIKAGLDAELPRTAGYGKRFVRAVKRGEVSEEVLDRSVHRILTKKFELGLFENPYVDEDADKITELYNNPENKKLASEIARKSIILLKNEKNLLPLDKSISTIAVIGPNANSVRNLLGDYTFISQLEATATNATGLRELGEDSLKVLKEITESKDPDAFTRRLYDIKSILDAIKEKVSKSTNVKYAKGCGIRGFDKSGFDEAINIAERSDLVILVVGEKAGLTLDCTSGESRDRTTLSLPGVQEDLVRVIHATGKPIILVLINGRPLSLPWEQEHIPAIIEAWLPGEEGAGAIADVLFGVYNPGGKLPISIPRNVGQIPIFHNHKPSGTTSIWTWNYVDINTTPLYPFGYGLSYTNFEYSDLHIDKPKVDSRDAVQISCKVKNTGKVHGDEVIQLYLHDREAHITRPVEELFGFKRIVLDPGEVAIITFTISMQQLGFHNEQMNYIVEPGKIDVYIGSINSMHGPEVLSLDQLISKKDMKLKGQFEIIGDTIDLSQHKQFFTKITVKKN
ncbi:MAG: glycoside hydrolase family 3 N-terminal domain-containing protein [Promethearchaeota archaeon]